jgi:hypothetical protein
MSVQILYPKGTAIELLEIDATLSLAESLTAQATEHPVETGGVISDHVIEKPKTLRLEGIISATPLPTQATARDFGFDSFSNALIDIEGQGISPPDRFRAQDALETLRAVHAARLPVTVGTGIHSPDIAQDFHNDLIIETLEFPRDPTTGDAVRFVATLKEITTVESATVALATSPKPGTVKKGKQSPKKEEPSGPVDSGMRAAAKGFGYQPKNP